MCLTIHPSLAVSTFMQTLKQESSKWMSMAKDKFPAFERWGNGYAAFTYSINELNTVIDYIRNQKEHHKKVDLNEEFNQWLREMGINPEEDMFLKD